MQPALLMLGPKSGITAWPLTVQHCCSMLGVILSCPQAGCM